MEERFKDLDLMRRVANEIAAECKAVSRCIREEGERAAASARAHFFQAPAWPSREESDRQFREAWLALEAEANAPQAGWEPGEGAPILDEPLEEPADAQLADSDCRNEALRSFERVVLLAQLRGKNHFLSRLLRRVNESAKARKRFKSRSAR